MKNTLIAAITCLITLSACAQNHSSTASTKSTESATAARHASDTVQNLSADEALTLLDDPEVITIDVRTPDEVAQGYIPGTDKFIDLFGDFRTEIQDLDPEATYLIYCASGARSADASAKLVDKGFRHVYNLTGGTESWTGELTQD